MDNMWLNIISEQAKYCCQLNQSLCHEDDQNGSEPVSSACGGSELLLAVALGPDGHPEEPDHILSSPDGLPQVCQRDTWGPDHCCHPAPLHQVLLIP